jgi:ABC-2 type transport system ATP-binding protein
VDLDLGDPFMFAIETQNLTKKFGDLIAVDSASIKVKQGEIFGLLGPNGAGKTTLISILVTMKKPTSGKGMVEGVDVAENPGAVRKNIGITFQDPSLDEDLTAYENLELHAAMYGIPRKEREEKITEILKMVELEDRRNSVVKTFSGGMRRRLEIGRTLLHSPKVLFLDEPTIGLDPQTRNHIWDYVKKLRETHGVTILLTTHYMDEADSLCDRVAIMDKGKIVAMDTATALKDSLGGDTIVIETSQAAKLCKMLGGLECAKEAVPHDGKVTLRVTQGEKKIPKIMQFAKEKGIDVESVSLHKPTLDDVFLHYTGKTIREEEASGKDSMRMHRKAWGRGK